MHRCSWCKADIGDGDTSCPACGAVVPEHKVRSVEVQCGHCGEVYLSGFIACPACSEPSSDNDGTGNVRLCRNCGVLIGRNQASPACDSPSDAAVWPPPVYQDIPRRRRMQPGRFTYSLGFDVLIGFLFVFICNFAFDIITWRFTLSRYFSIGIVLVIGLQLVGWRYLANRIKLQYPHLAEGMIYAWWACFCISILPFMSFAQDLF